MRLSTWWSSQVQESALLIRKSVSMVEHSVLQSGENGKTRQLLVVSVPSHPLEQAHTSGADSLNTGAVLVTHDCPANMAKCPSLGGLWPGLEACRCLISQKSQIKYMQSPADACFLCMHACKGSQKSRIECRQSPALGLWQVNKARADQARTIWPSSSTWPVESTWVGPQAGGE